MRLDHVAHISRSPERTHEFYSGFLGLKLAQAYRGDLALLLVYALPGGGSLAFSSFRGESQPADIAAEWQRQHVGLTVQSREEFDAWLKRLREQDIRHEWIDDERVYFSDPDGLVLELEVAEAAADNPSAPSILADWLKA